MSERKGPLRGIARGSWRGGAAPRPQGARRDGSAGIDLKNSQQSVMMTGRGGTTVLVGVVPVQQMVPLAAADLTLQEKKITGSYMGSNRFRFDMPRYVDFYLDGRLELDEMISARIGRNELNPAFDRMRKGEVARQVVVFE